MARTLIFNIPAPGPSQDPVYKINWYESDNGIMSWTKIDTILVSDLVIGSDGKYHWTSELADPYKYAELKTESEIGIESITGFIVAPESPTDTTPSDVYAEKINTGVATYRTGDTIELMLEVESDVAASIGNSLNVFIIDKFENVMAVLTAELLGEAIYLASWKIPKALSKLYNVNGEPDSSDIYYLSDKWILPGSTFVQFNLQVYKTAEEVITNNSLFTIEVDDVLSNDGGVSEPYTFKFSSNLTPYYSSVYDVKSTLSEELSSIDDFDIAKDIMLASRQVDLHMKPSTIYRQDQYDFAVRMYVKYYVSRQHLIFLLNINAEKKELDTLKYSKNSGDPEKALESMDALIARYTNIILAGGKDTLFIPKTFQKGVLDPNRTEANRAGLDTSDDFPWVNTTTGSSLANINGNLVEIRGTRTVTFMRNRISAPTEYLRSEGLV